MNRAPELFPIDSITPLEWAWVQDLIQEVQRQELGDAFARNLGEWDLAVRQFRKVEYRRIILGSPTEDDFLHHAACLHALLALGNILLMETRKFSDSDLTALGIARQTVAAYVAELEQSFREWHHGISETELNAVREKIFGGTP